MFFTQHKKWGKKVFFQQKRQKIGPEKRFQKFFFPCTVGQTLDHKQKKRVRV